MYNEFYGKIGGDIMSESISTQIMETNTKPCDSKNPIMDVLNNFLLYRKTQTDPNLEDEDTRELLKNLHEAKKEMEIANSNFEFAEEDGLVDLYIYRMKAAETRYQYLLKKVKQKGTNLENINLL